MKIKNKILPIITTSKEELCPSLAECTAKTEASKQKLIDLFAEECEKQGCIHWVHKEGFWTLDEFHQAEVLYCYDNVIRKSFDNGGRAEQGLYHKNTCPCYSDKNRAETEKILMEALVLYHSEEGIKWRDEYYDLLPSTKQT